MGGRSTRWIRSVLISRFSNRDCVDGHGLRGGTAASAQCVDRLDNVAALDHFTEVGVERGQTGAIATRDDKELTAIGVRACIGHGERPDAVATGLG